VLGEASRAITTVRQLQQGLSPISAQTAGKMVQTLNQLAVAQAVKLLRVRGGRACRAVPSHAWAMR
jgi:hypothetical protein